MRMRKKKNLIPRMDRCAPCHVRDGFALKGRWREALMPGAREVHVELGCGKGRFTAGTAAEHPDVLFIAIEKVPDALVVAMERAMDLGLKNVFFVVGDAALLPDYFAPDEVDRVYINFCDPWPSNRHAKRRLTHRDFLNIYRQVLRTGGEIHFKTDNRPLFEFSLLEFPRAGYALSEVTRNLHENGPRGVMTDYEAKKEKLFVRETPFRSWADPMSNAEALRTKSFFDPLLCQYVRITPGPAGGPSPGACGSSPGSGWRWARRPCRWRPCRTTVRRSAGR